ncbi:MAG: arginine--tRNA ligase [Candidatus Nanoarchaeia archaeon]|jgi:arginyl-tRNA synthetase|nr:arginine--tRNA ligase [Candidatus Nanoarchaeia archaeon]MDD3994043.1 arginine--tRNA ligase [Candidatus Nanoarchaeia archaeon]MDD4563341.1 arginine--tRNA ligase [Candidatus Nanoarchaeia archaeon]
MKEKIAKLISKETKINIEEIKKLIEIPPSDSFGDYSFPCYQLAKIKKQSPLLISQELSNKLRKNISKEISSIEVKSAYVNFFIDKIYLAKKTIERTKKKSWGEIKNNNSQNIGIEYPSPNTNKSLHIGHLRNIIIGESISQIMKNANNNVYHLNLYNDRGILISKTMVAYELFAENINPLEKKIKPDKFIADLYVKFNKEAKKNKELEEKAKEKLRLWENKDKKTIELWKKLNSWAYQGLQQTFDLFGLSKIDKNYYESEIYTRGKEIINKGIKKGLFKEKDNAIIIDLNKENLGEKVLLRSDKTSVYITQDLYLAEQKIKDFNLDSSYYVVGNDQEYHFKVLFTILEKLGLKKDWKHFSYGMVTLPSGKMKSREGNIVSADDFIKETQEIAKKGLIDRNPKINKNELEKKSLIIALAAIKYSLIKIDIKKDLIFNPEKALSFEGDTGPYLLYSYARANSILKKIKSTQKEYNIIDLTNSEIKLIKKINNFENILTETYQNLTPNTLANYVYELAQIFNEFYHSCSIINSKEKEFRLDLVKAFKKTLKKSLDLLSIQTIEEM